MAAARDSDSICAVDVPRSASRPCRTLTRAALLALMLVAGAGAVAAPRSVAAEHPACEASERAQPAAGRTTGRPPLVIGDSVLLGAVREVARAGFEVDARGCRALPQAVKIMRSRRRAKTLPHLVVIALGANWLIRPRELDAALRIAGLGRVLALVTPREPDGASGSDTRVIRRMARRNPDRVHVLDWVRFSRGHRSWFGADGVHLGRAGAAGLARLLSRALPLAVAPPCS